MENEAMGSEDHLILGGIPYQDDDSGSAYQTSDAEQSASHDTKVKTARSPRARSVKWTDRSSRKKIARKSSEECDSVSDADEGVDSETDAKMALKDEQIRKEALDWAANFHAPTSPGDIKSPPRQAASKRSKRKRRPQEPSRAEGKRLRAHYNPQYRELLNVDINDVGARSIAEGNTSLQESQIGSSIWTPFEKDSFFISLSRLGRDNVRGIANRIGTKSELEVQEYIQLLQKSIVEKKTQGRKSGHTDFPAAFEVSEECCELLERAGDSLASLQDRYEVEIERTKWGESWLLTRDVSYWVSKRRKQEGGEEAIDEVLPAANLLNLNNWLELSDRIFMNPAAPHEDDNWHNLAVEGESPAIRATAFEDFHSLAVYVTKKLVSTILFCTMSRERAMNANKTRHAEVNPGDVEAAANILKMKRSTQDFWMKCARRCNLQVVDDDASEESPMIYNDVEAALSSSYPSRSRSASRNPSSRAPTLDPHRADTVAETSDEFESADESPQDYSSLSLSDGDLAPTPRPSIHSKRVKGQAAHARAQENYTEAFDMEASRLEELRLWSMLKQSPPFEIRPEPLEGMVKPKNGNKVLDDGWNWRDNVEFRSPWELLETPVPEDAFERNRALKTKMPRRGVRMNGGQSNVAMNSEFVEEDLTSLDGEEDGEDEDSREFEQQESEREDHNFQEGYDNDPDAPHRPSPARQSESRAFSKSGQEV